jgi:phage shock protein PspC (stress-responsive transcriptional regulator)
MALPDDLQKLYDLRAKGALTEEEFALAKKRLLEVSADDVNAKSRKPNEPASALNQFRRSIGDRWIGGVCGGLGEMTGIPSWSWRILFVLTAFLSGVGLVMYVLLWIFVPAQTDAPRPFARSESERT